MRAALLTEYRKLVSTRMWWVLLLVMVAYLLFIAVVMAFSLATGGGAGGPGAGSAAVPQGVDAATTVYALANPIGYVFPLLVGSLAFTTEFRHRTITSSLLVEPRRGVLVVAKLVSSVVIGLVFGIVGTASVVLGGAPVLAAAGDGAFLASGDVWSLLAWSVVVLTLWTVVGVAFGGLVPNQVAAIVVIVAFTQFVEPIARVVGSAVDALSGVAQFLPGAAADAVLGTSFFGGLGGGATDLLPRWAGLAVLVAYALVFAVAARSTTLRKDIG